MHQRIYRHRVLIAKSTRELIGRQFVPERRCPILEDRLYVLTLAELGYFLDLQGSICATDPKIVDGRMSVPDGPGFGAEIDRKQLDHFREDR